MTLILLLVIPVLGGIAAWILAVRDSRSPRWVAMASLMVDFVLALQLWVETRSLPGPWLADVNVSWIPQLGINFHLAADGLSLVMVLLTLFLGLISVACSWTEIQEKVGFFHFVLMTTISGILGVFLALDLILFYFFWEVMLVPMYFLIGIWGHENRYYAAVKFFLFTQAGGLLMLFSILGLYFVHGNSTGIYTFDYFKLLGTSMSDTVSMWLMLGFFIAFAVKLPAVPFHTWLPDAHTEAPTAGSVILAGLLLKTGGYGLLRFVWPLFPDAAAAFAQVAMALAVVGIIYGAFMAFAQTDLKRFVAYTSVSHLGFVLLGIFSRNEWALQGAIIQMICHGIGTGALFVLVGALQERIHTRDLERMSGLWTTVPRMGGITLFFALASLGLPGLGNFVGEFLVLVGTYKASIYFTVPAVLGLVFAAVYSLSMIQRAFFGPNKERWTLPDLSLRETAITGFMIAGLLWLGLFPQQVLNTSRASVEAILKIEIARPAASEAQDGKHSVFGQTSVARSIPDLGN
jgi:NADH-quinone oxidoreductase subunit M